jgi:hypothetical protein
MAIICSYAIGFKSYVRVYYRPIDLLLFPLLNSAVFLIHKQSNARLNVGSPLTQFILPQGNPELKSSCI